MISLILLKGHFRVGQQEGMAVMQPGNTSKSGTSHVVTREVGLGSSFAARSFGGPALIENTSFEGFRPWIESQPGIVSTRHL